MWVKRFLPFAPINCSTLRTERFRQFKQKRIALLYPVLCLQVVIEENRSVHLLTIHTNLFYQRSEVTRFYRQGRISQYIRIPIKSEFGTRTGQIHLYRTISLRLNLLLTPYQLLHG